MIPNKATPPAQSGGNSFHMHTEGTLSAAGRLHALADKLAGERKGMTPPQEGDFADHSVWVACLKMHQALDQDLEVAGKEFSRIAGLIPAAVAMVIDADYQGGQMIRATTEKPGDRLA